MKYDQQQFDWQKKAAAMDAISRKNYESEDLLQADCFAWFQHYLREEAYLAAIPNGGQRNKLEAMKFKATGTRAGIADMFLMSENAQFFWIELKNKKDYIDPEQAKFKERAEGFGFSYYMVNTFNQFRCLVQYLLNIPENKFETLI